MSDRNVSKQRRAAQNKAAREALANRKSRAALGPSDRPVPPSLNGSAEPVAATGRTRGRIKGPVGQAGRPARTAPVRQARTPTNPISAFIAQVQAQPGGKAVFFAFMFSLAAAVLILGTKSASETVMSVPFALIKDFRLAHHLAQPKGVAKQDFDHDHAIAVMGPVLGVLGAIAPVIITGTTMVLHSKGTRLRRNVNTGVIAMLLVYIFAQPITEFLLFPAGGLVFAMFQARKADPPPMRTRKPRGGAAADEGGAIETSAVEGDEYDHEG